MRIVAGMFAAALALPAHGEGWMAVSDVTLAVEWTQAEDRLLAQYVVSNASSEAIYVFDQVFVTLPHGARMVEADRAYVSVLADGTLLIEKLVPDLPADRDVESPELPYATLVPPGGRAEGTVRLSVPVLTTPAYGAPATGAARDQASRVVFRIGYAALRPDVVAVEIKGAIGPIWSLPHAWASVRQQVLQSDAFAIDLPIAKPIKKQP